MNFFLISRNSFPPNVIKLHEHLSNHCCCVTWERDGFEKGVLLNVRMTIFWRDLYISSFISSSVILFCLYFALNKKVVSLIAVDPADIG